MYLYALDDTSAKWLSQGALPNLSLDPGVVQGLLGSRPVSKVSAEQSADKVLGATADPIPAPLVEIQLAIEDRGPVHPISLLSKLKDTARS